MCMHASEGKLVCHVLCVMPDASSSFDDIQTQIEDGIDKIEKELTSVVRQSMKV